MRLRSSHSSVSALALLAVLALCASGCDNRPSSALKGQVNTTVAFHGLTVDQDGRPLPGVRVEYEIQAYPKDWTFETRDRPYDMSKAGALSDAAGRFTLTVTGSVIRRTVLQGPPGYRSFTEEDSGSERGRDIPSVLSRLRIRIVVESNNKRARRL